MHCYVDIIQYNAVHKFVGVLDNLRSESVAIYRSDIGGIAQRKRYGLAAVHPKMQDE